MVMAPNVGPFRPQRPTSELNAYEAPEERSLVASTIACFAFGSCIVRIWTMSAFAHARPPCDLLPIHSEDGRRMV